jgi:hypothetical protein
MKFLSENQQKKMLEEDVKKALPEIQEILKRYNLDLAAEIVYLPVGILPKPVFNRKNYDRDNPGSDSSLNSNSPISAE